VVVFGFDLFNCERNFLKNLHTMMYSMSTVPAREPQCAQYTVCTLSAPRVGWVDSDYRSAKFETIMTPGNVNLKRIQNELSWIAATDQILHRTSPMVWGKRG
jgi:hypothetical protein